MVFLKNKRLGRQTVAFTNPPSIAAGSCVVGQKEGEGPLRKWFDYISDDSYFGQSSWEKAESVMLSKCFALCCDKAKIPPTFSICLRATFSTNVPDQRSLRAIYPSPTLAFTAHAPRWRRACRSLR